MPTSLTDWDDKHRNAARDGAAEPASFVQELLPLSPRGPALDLACGTGRHALLLAARQQRVTAVDGSSVALDILENRARVLKYPTVRVASNGGIPSPQERITLLQADLEAAELPTNTFALIVCVQYLQRSLFSQIARALRPGGMLLFETYTTAQLEFSGGPRSLAHLLEPGELRTAFSSLNTVFYRELRAGRGIASLIARKGGG
ncbi:MAG TPA: class I SAM-dependent methyltransferase [Candidatus Acidoferrum sp.]|jgi:SAM-dependent methyltransferase